MTGLVTPSFADSPRTVCAAAVEIDGRTGRHPAHGQIMRIVAHFVQAHPPPPLPQGPNRTHGNKLMRPV